MEFVALQYQEETSALQHTAGVEDEEEEAQVVVRMEYRAPGGGADGVPCREMMERKRKPRWWCGWSTVPKRNTSVQEREQPVQQRLSRRATWEQVREHNGSGTGIIRPATAEPSSNL